MVPLVTTIIWYVLPCKEKSSRLCVISYCISTFDKTSPEAGGGAIAGDRGVRVGSGGSAAFSTVHTVRPHRGPHKTRAPQTQWAESGGQADIRLSE